MHTELLTVPPGDFAHSPIARAAALLRAGELVAIPTETVYGLAADAGSEQAVAAIFAAKGRPQDNPLIVHIADFDSLPPLVAEVHPQAAALASALWPGPLTLVCKKSGRVPPIVSGGLDTVAVRLPAHPVARAVIQAAGRPLAAPSANRSGSPSPTTAAHVMEDLAGRIAAVLDGGPCAVGVESTVLSLTGERPMILRPGGVTSAQIEAVIGPVAIHPSATANNTEEDAPASPGMKYKHYAPAARLLLVRASSAAYAAYVNARAEPGTRALCFDEDIPALRVPATSYGAQDDSAAQAQRLFAALREADAPDTRVIYARCPNADGVGLAVYNRLLRAAGFEVITL